MPRELERELIDFEDSIKLESITLKEALELHCKNDEDSFIVGPGIGNYINTLHKLKFRSIWQLLRESNSPEATAYWRRVRTIDADNISEVPKCMYGYIDYVLKDTNGHIMIFLPNKSQILAEGTKSEEIGWVYPTYNEITRVLQYFPEYSERIHFITGLFDYTAEEFEECWQYLW